MDLCQQNAGEKGCAGRTVSRSKAKSPNPNLRLYSLKRTKCFNGPVELSLSTKNPLTELLSNVSRWTAWVRNATENVGTQPQLLMHTEWLRLCRDRQMLPSRPLVHKCSMPRTLNLNDSAKLMFFGYAALGTTGSQRQGTQTPHPHDNVKTLVPGCHLHDPSSLGLESKQSERGLSLSNHLLK